MELWVIVGRSWFGLKRKCMHVFSRGGRRVQVRAAPPPPKQHPRGQVKRREEVEITLV